MTTKHPGRSSGDAGISVRKAMRAALAALLGALATLGLFVPTAHAAPGDLDPTFGTGGIVTQAEEVAASAVKIQPDGKLVVVGEIKGSLHWEFLVARYNPDGSLDTGFGGGDGIITTDFGPGPRGQEALALAIEPSGKLLVAGQANNGEFALARYNPDGSLDTGFGGGDGMVTTGFNPEADRASGIVLQGDGRIVLAGTTSVPVEEFIGEPHFALARYNSDGTLDTSFGSGGKVLGPEGELNALVEEPGGKLLVGGEAGYFEEFTVGRYNSDGTLDNSFGNGGLKTIEFGPNSSAAGLLVQLDGKIVASGDGNPGLVVVRLDPTSGALDSSFGGGDGLIKTTFGGSCCPWANSAALQSDGRIVIAGQLITGGDFFEDAEWALARFDPNGAPDKSFGTNGLLVTPEFAGDVYGNRANGVTVQADGRIVAVGEIGMHWDEYGYFVYSDMAIARYEGGGPPPPDYHFLRITKVGTGTGYVGGPELSCGINCAADYVAGETVTLEASALPGSTFAGWSGGGCSGTGACEVTVNADTAVTATFTASEGGGSDGGGGGESGGGGGSPPGNGKQISAPNTLLGSHPPAKLVTKAAKVKVKFKFSSSAPGAIFKCKLDKGAFKPCQSPKSYKVKPGKHVFKVEAIDAAGADATPAIYRFKVVRHR